MLSWSGPILYPILRRVGKPLRVMVPFDFGLQLFLFALCEAVVMHVWVILHFPFRHLFSRIVKSANWTEGLQRCLYSFPLQSCFCAREFFVCSGSKPGGPIVSQVE